MPKLFCIQSGSSRFALRYLEASPITTFVCVLNKWKKKKLKKTCIARTRRQLVFLINNLRTLGLWIWSSVGIWSTHETVSLRRSFTAFSSSILKENSPESHVGTWACAACFFFCPSVISVFKMQDDKTTSEKDDTTRPQADARRQVHATRSDDKSTRRGDKSTRQDDKSTRRDEKSTRRNDTMPYKQPLQIYSYLLL